MQNAVMLLNVGVTNICSLLSLAITGHGAGLGGLSLVTVTAPPSWPGQVSRHETRFTTNIFQVGFGSRQAANPWSEEQWEHGTQ